MVLVVLEICDYFISTLIIANIYDRIQLIPIVFSQLWSSTVRVSEIKMIITVIITIMIFTVNSLEAIARVPKMVVFDLGTLFDNISYHSLA